MRSRSLALCVLLIGGSSAEAARKRQSEPPPDPRKQAALCLNTHQTNPATYDPKVCDDLVRQFYGPDAAPLHPFDAARLDTAAARLAHARGLVMQRTAEELKALERWVRSGIDMDKNLDAIGKLLTQDKQAYERDVRWLRAQADGLKARGEDLGPKTHEVLQLMDQTLAANHWDQWMERARSAMRRP